MRDSRREASGMSDSYGEGWGIYISMSVYCQFPRKVMEAGHGGPARSRDNALHLQ